MSVVISARTPLTRLLSSSHSKIASLGLIHPKQFHTHTQATAIKSSNRTSLISSSLLKNARSFSTATPASISSATPASISVSPVSLVQQLAPDFTATAVHNGAFTELTLSEYRGRWVVFFFYPLDFTFVCPTEIIAFSDRVKEFNDLNTAVIAASVDSEYSHLAWCNTSRDKGGLGHMNIPIIADITKSISAAYGVLLPEAGVALRGLFIIDPEGIIRQVTVNDLPVGRSVDETLRLVRAFQYVAKHGEVCPADWTEGGETMKADPKGSQSYFKKKHGGTSSIGAGKNTQATTPGGKL